MDKLTASLCCRLEVNTGANCRCWCSAPQNANAIPVQCKYPLQSNSEQLFWILFESFLSFINILLCVACHTIFGFTLFSIFFVDFSFHFFSFNLLHLLVCSFSFFLGGGGFLSACLFNFTSAVWLGVGMCLLFMPYNWTRIEGKSPSSSSSSSSALQQNVFFFLFPFCRA